MMESGEYFITEEEQRQRKQQERKRREQEKTEERKRRREAEYQPPAAKTTKKSKMDTDVSSVTCHFFPACVQRMGIFSQKNEKPDTSALIRNLQKKASRKTKHSNTEGIVFIFPMQSVLCHSLLCIVADAVDLLM